MGFRTGQRVVCVDDSHDPLLHRYGDWPSEGETYTITAVTKSKGRHASSVGLQLVEIQNAGWNEVVGCLVAYGFAARRFRPLTDISVFENLLAAAQPSLHDHIVEAGGA